METTLRQALATWASYIKSGEDQVAAEMLLNGNKWSEERWKTFYDALAKSIRAGTFHVADEQIVGEIGHVLVLLEDRAEPQRVCFMNDGKQWRILASYCDFTACPWDYNMQRSHAMIDLNADYMKWAARRSGWTAQQLLSLSALLQLARTKRASERKPGKSGDDPHQPEGE